LRNATTMVAVRVRRPVRRIRKCLPSQCGRRRPPMELPAPRLSDASPEGWGDRGGARHRRRVLQALDLSRRHV
jgi:hypothetical protein